MQNSMYSASKGSSNLCAALERSDYSSLLFLIKSLKNSTFLSQFMCVDNDMFIETDQSTPDIKL